MTADILEADARARRRALFVARLGVVALAALCFRLSFDALQYAASTHGAVYAPLAKVYALLPDTAIVICAAIGYLASLDGDGDSPTVALATAIKVTACILSTWANVIAADNNLPGMIMAGVPSPMLFACLELLEADARRTRRHRLAVAAEPVAAPVTDTADTAGGQDMSADNRDGSDRGQEAVTGADGRGRADTTADTDPVELPAKRPRPVPRRALADVTELVAAHVAAGGRLDDVALTDAVAAAIHRSPRTARRRLEPYRNGHIKVLAADSIGGAA